MEATEWNFEQFKQLSEENERLKELVNTLENDKMKVLNEGNFYHEKYSEQAKRIEEFEKEKQLTINGSELNTLLYQEQIKKLEGLLNTERHLVNVHKKKYECLEELLMEYVNSTGATETNLKARIKAALNL